MYFLVVVKMLIFLMFYNASSVAMAILTARIAGPPYRKMPQWLEKLLTRSQKVDVTQDNSSVTSVAGSVQAINSADDENMSQSVSCTSAKKTEPERRIKSCSTDSENMEKKWKLLADLLNRIFFMIFTVALVAMLLVISTTWILT